jgi:uncharacterized membrane protein YhaH (DUF805 family)
MGPLDYFLSVRGRTARPGMVAITLLFFGLGFLRPGLAAAGIDPRIVTWPQLILLWPFLVAIPIRRFHDMGKSWWWPVVFLTGVMLGLLIMLLDLNARADLIGMTGASALAEPEAYLAGLEALNAQRSGEPIEPVGAMGMGGFSTALILILIEFGWMLLIPGQRETNRYGPPPSTR